MKVVLPKETNANGGVRKAPPLSLVPDTIADQEETCSYKLYSNPADANSAKYSFTMPILKGDEGDVRAAIMFYKNMFRVFNGLAMANTAGDAQMRRRELAERMLRGVASTAFITAFTNHQKNGLNQAQQAAVDAEPARDIAGGEDEATYQARLTTARNGATYDATALDLEASFFAIIIAMAPYKALQNQKRWMRRSLRKPKDMTVRTFASHLLRLNVEELPLLPPFNPNQGLQDDELIDILVSACPKSWSNEMDKQNFDPLLQTRAAVLDFLARMETAAAEDPMNKVIPKKSKTSKDSASSGKSTGTKYCHFHGHNTTHDSNGCRTLKKMAESTTRSDGSDSKKRFGNKTWKRKADDNKSKTKKDLATFIKKTMRKELNSFAASKKRKTSDKDDESSFDEAELDNMDLSGFNYQDMENLSIDDKSEGEVSC